MFQRILVATDGSSLSKKAVKGAIDLAATAKAELVALHVVPRYPMSYFEGAVGLSPHDIERTEKAWTDKAETLLTAVVEQARERGVTAQPAVMHSDMVGESILSAAKKHHCDVIVMASHGRKGLERVLLGSETQYVLTHGAIPVLVLR
jgi:nucleotide-binding universal stress UspA family protein